jgi:hypothetical protein
MAFWFVVAVLGVYRVTHLLAAEDGPFALVAALRERAGAGFIGQLLDCFNCLSLWVAAPFALVLTPRWEERLGAWLALSGAAVLLHKVAGPHVPVAAAAYVEGGPAQQEDADGMLRKQAGGARGAAPSGTAGHVRVPRLNEPARGGPGESP